MDYAAFLDEIDKEAGRKIAVLPVTKGHTPEEIAPLYRFGFRSFGESRLQDALPKISALPQDIAWHYIGTLQTKKVEKVLQFFQVIHSVDSVELAEKIASSQTKTGKVPKLFLQVNASGEESKHGLSPEEWEKSIDKLLMLKELCIVGWMTMAPMTEDKERVRKTFSEARELRDRINNRYGLDWQELSMGMSQDYRIALQEGATLLRIGSTFFGM